MTDLNVIAVIPARGGSTRLPMKNIKPLRGRPLIDWVTRAALAAKGLSRVLVSTDHDDIAAAAKAAGAEVPFRRPEALSGNIPSAQVLQHAVEFDEQDRGQTVDVVVTLQPTTPFIRAHDIEGCVARLLNDATLDAVISVAPVHERPEWMFTMDDSNALHREEQETLQGNATVSQCMPPLYHPNGGIYATRRETLFEQNSLIGAHPGGWQMGRLRSVDIDEAIDFLLAEAVAEYLQSHPDQE